jgi:hypothetical protein
LPGSGFRIVEGVYQGPDGGCSDADQGLLSAVADAAVNFLESSHERFDVAGVFKLAELARSLVSYLEIGVFQVYEELGDRFLLLLRGGEGADAQQSGGDCLRREEPGAWAEWVGHGSLALPGERIGGEVIDPETVV